MLLTYTYLYKIITISLKTISWRQLVKPSRYRNTMYTCIPIKVGHGVRSSTANTYVSIRNFRRPRCRVLGKSRTRWFVDCQHLHLGHQNHPPTSLSSFWKRSEKLSPINSDSKGCGNINVEHMFLGLSIIVHHTQSSSRLYPMYNDC